MTEDRTNQLLGWILEKQDRMIVLLDMIAGAVSGLSWACGCGHMNGANLPTCAQCGRKPKELR